MANGEGTSTRRQLSNKASLPAPVNPLSIPKPSALQQNDDPEAYGQPGYIIVMDIN